MYANEKLEIMEQHMRVSWDEINTYLSDKLGSKQPDFRLAYGKIWAESKWPLFKKFGDRLTLTKEVENTLSNTDIRDAYVEKVLDNIRDKVSLRANLVATFFMTEFTFDELTTNRVAENKELSGRKIGKGMKISRAMKLFIEDKKELDIVQTSFSRFVQELEAKGQLEVSLDFFDILCMSVNPKGNWRSCHHFINGEYNGGAFAYALDTSSAIAQIFLGGDKDELVRNKIWRQMVWFDNKQESAVLSRQYPMANGNNRKSAVDLLQEELGTENYRYGYTEPHYLQDSMCDLGNFHYNDVSYDACSKVTLIHFDDKEEIFQGENGSTDIVRDALKLDRFKPTYFVGVEELMSPFSFDWYDEADYWSDNWMDY